MALARLRRSSRVIVLLVLASFWGLSHRRGDDVCLADLQSHDESKHVIGAPDHGAPDHCVICHSIRTPRRPFGAVAHFRSPIVPGAVVDLPEVLSRRGPSLDNLPARAPPVTLT